MKLYFKLFALVLFAGYLSSCENFVGGDINADPNNPIAVPVSAQLPAIQIAMVDLTGGAFSRFNCMLTQQVEGVARQWSSFNQYTGLTPNRFDAAWDNTYENVLNELQTAKANSMADGNNHTLAVCYVMEAYTLMQATDVWDDIPYSEAFKGIEVTSPQYDSQADIYGVINSRLNDAISLFAGPQGPVGPASGDVLYGGDITAWTNAATAIRARAKLHFKDYSGAASDAAAFSSSADNLAFNYPDANAAGQWFRFNRDRTGDLEFHPTMRALMNSTQDTNRLNVMDQTFITDHPYLVADFNQELVTYREMQFIIAEASARGANDQAGYDAYMNGIKASFTRLGLGDAEFNEYITQTGVDPGVGNLTLEGVMTQKYVAMFLQPETYSDWRRTGFPAITPTSGNAVPVRWDYSSGEYLFNASSPAEGSVNVFTDKVGWNQ